MARKLNCVGDFRARGGGFDGSAGDEPALPVPVLHSIPSTFVREKTDEHLRPAYRAEIPCTRRGGSVGGTFCQGRGGRGGSEVGEEHAERTRGEAAGVTVTEGVREGEEGVGKERGAGEGDGAAEAGDVGVGDGCWGRDWR